MEFSTALAVEAWTLWSFGMVLVVARMTSRVMLLGSIKKLQADDWIMFFTVFTFTGAVVSAMQVANNGSNYLPDGATALLTPEEVASAIYGSKMNLVLEEFTLFTTWQVKACLLLLYSRLTLGLRESLAVKVVAGYCVLGFVLIQILYLGVWCRPIQQYWALPVHDSQCASYINHMITATVFNVSSDLMMLLIPLPILIRAQLPLKKKLILCGVFSLGIFVILAAVLNRYYNFTLPYNPVFLNWYVGELSTAVFVANIPLCWPLLRRVFKVGTFNDKRSGATNPSHPPHPQRHIGNSYGTRAVIGQRLPSDDEMMAGFSESEERINREDNWPIGKESFVLGPVDGKTGLKTLVRTGKDAEGSDQECEDGITKTVQVTQYTL